MTSGVSLDWIKMCAMRPASRKACAGAPGLEEVSLIILPRSVCRPIRGSRARQQRFSILQSGEHLHLSACGLAQRDVAQAGDLVCVDHVNRLQLSALVDSRTAESRATVARRERNALCPNIPERMSGISGRQSNFHKETAAGRIGGRNDLRQLCRSMAALPRVSRKTGAIWPARTMPDVIFVHGDFEPVAPRIFQQ